MTDQFTPGFLTRLPEPPQKVALLKASRIGDFINSTPAFRAFRRALPQAEISMITLPILRDIAMRSPNFDRYIEFPGYPGLAEQFFDARKVASFFQAMQAEQFDLAVQMQGSGVNSNPFMLMLGAKHTVGFIRPGDPTGLLDAAIPLPEVGYEVERILTLPLFLGAPLQGRKPEFHLWNEDHKAAGDLLAAATPPLIGMHPSARDPARCWPLDRYVEVGQTLLARHGGTIVMLGEQAEHAVAEEMAQQMGGAYLNLTGKTSLPVLGAIIDRLSVLITNDTGPAHIAYALAAPTVTIFSVGDPERNGPILDGPFRILVPPCPCRQFESPRCLPENRCLLSITVPQVVEAAEAVMR